LQLAHFALRYVITKDEESKYISNKTGYLNFNLKRLGLDNSGTYTVSIVPIGNTFASVGTPKTYTLNILQEISDSIAYVLKPLAEGTTIQYEITVTIYF
jgi:hypothetical protein